MFQTNVLKIVVGALGAAVCFFSAPVMANSAASADIAAPLRAAEAAKSGIAVNVASDEFHQLFASWKALDNSSPAFSTPARASGRVSIPSLIPVTSNRAMSSGFGMRVHPVLGGLRAHKGLDLPATTGTPIHASADGTIGKADWFGGYGLFVEIEHGAGMETRYGHMSRIAVAEGQRVRKGDVIGYVGSTGRSTGAHLHYEVRIGGEAVNPIPYMQTVAPGVAADALLASNDALAR